MLLIIVVAALRYGSKTPGLVVKDVVITRHGSRMPRWLGASSAAVAATGDRSAATEVASGEEQQLLQNWWKKVPTKFKSRRLACGGRSKCDSGNWRPLGYDRGGRRRGAAVAPDDGSLLVAVKGSR
ncbi:hypothetical protein BHM03_00000261 [Ensete ventricosum]|nr:hypothetical protein BHM03_00000261 [Ensete ventricosum]